MMTDLGLEFSVANDTNREWPELLPIHGVEIMIAYHYGAWTTVPTG